MRRGILLLCCLSALAALSLWRPFSPAPARLSGSQPPQAETYAPPPSEPDRQEAPPEDPAPPPAEPAPVTGTIHGDIHDGEGLLPWPASCEDRPAVSLCAEERDRRLRSVARALVDDQGAFLFPCVLPGRYYVLVEPETLHADYLPPHRQETRYGSLTLRGFWATCVTVPKTGGEFRVSLMVHRKAVVDGHVYDARGLGAPAIHVRLETANPGLGPVTLNAYSNDTGYFRFEDVYPGTYRANACVGDEHPLSREVHPVPCDVLEMLPGQYHTISLRFGPAGDRVVQGTLIDQDGLPLEGITIDCYYRADTPQGVRWHDMGDVLARTKTDANGLWHFEGLPAEKVGINIDPNFRRDDPTQALYAYTRPVFLDLRQEPSPLILAPIRAERNRGFVVRGRVQVVEAFREANRLRANDLTLEAAFVTEKGEQRVPVPLGSRWTFWWRCQCPHPPVVLHLIWPEGGLDSITPLEPKALEVKDDLLIRFP
ncbi:MAG: carboxypeptidase regulatory-like domain-containing protein [Planctomycetes bacterium]|nr:carboxypeptidase regulatory-like domain-containing protein [Planctomycetota bacterium]